MKPTAIRIATDIRLRKEYFGGLVYDRRNGNILEVDKEAFQMLSLMNDKTVNPDEFSNFLIQNKVTKNQFERINDILRELIELKIIQASDQAASRPAFSIENEATHRSWLSAPETVHWAVTYRCEEKCPDCYVRRFSRNKSELNTNKALTLIDKIADWGVFQLAIGGGEPFARSDLLQLVFHAAERGLTVHVTTGKLHLDAEILANLSGSIKVLQIGIRAENILGSGSKEYFLQLQNLFNAVQNAGIIPGANLILTKSAIKQLPGLVNRLIRIGFRRIVLLRYKPPASIKRWEAERPTGQQLKSLYVIINSIVQQNPGLSLRVDCALSFVQRYLSPELAARLGIKGCVAADRILALSPDSSAYPCSQLVHPRRYAGNLLESEPQHLWDKSVALRRYRSFRTKNSFTHSLCGVCLKKAGCGGCRVFADDGLGGDPDCPDPILPPLNQLGKIGRAMDLAEYIKDSGSISVAEYMERYEVGQRTAIKELNASPDVLNVSEKPARKKKDEFVSSHEDIIQDIQGSIGYTSGGFPYATSEEIEEWIREPDYPAWIREPYIEQVSDIKNDHKVKHKKKKKKRRRKKK